jgi:glutamate/aspartate transport system substrate-binding protein
MAGPMNSARRLYAALAIGVALMIPASPAPAQDKSGAAPADTLKRVKDTGAITIGVREASVPFSFIDAQKQPQGYSIDLCLKVADAVKS